jgi:hypothetical protein
MPFSRVENAADRSQCHFPVWKTPLIAVNVIFPCGKHR